MKTTEERIERLEAAVLRGNVSAEGELPRQPMHVTEDGTVRFVPNAVVVHLLDEGGLDLNTLAMLEGLPAEDWRQFLQLIGCSVEGYCDYPFIDIEETKRVSAIAEMLQSAWASEDDE